MDLPSFKYRFCRLRSIVRLIFMGIFVNGVAFGQANKENLEKEKLSLKAEIDRTMKELNAVKKDKKLSLAEVNLIQKKLALRRRKINAINAQLIDIDNRIKSQTMGIENLQKDVSKLKKEYIQSIIISYRFYQRYNPTLYILNTQNFSNLFDRINYLKRYRSIRSVNVSQVKTTHKMLEMELHRLANTKQSQAQVLLEQKGEFGILQKEEKEKKEVVNQLKLNEKKLAETLKQKQRRWDKIKRLIEQEVKKEIARSKKQVLAEKKKENKKNKMLKTPPQPQTEEQKERASSVLTFTEKDFKLAKSFVANKGKLPWPIEGYITMHFGKNTIAEGSNINYNNSGITLHPKGVKKPIRSVFNGVVTSVQYIDGGMLITIRHGRYWTIYTPVYNPTVKPNQDVKIGEIIGYSNANSDNEELEFQLMKETSFLNPEQWLKRM